MKIKITGCSRDSYWYSGRIGEEFEVVVCDDPMDGLYCVEEIGVPWATSFIFYKDCEVVEDVREKLQEQRD